jgi:hypothetical protein
MYVAYMNLRQNPEAAVELLPNPGFEAAAAGERPEGVQWTSEGCPPGWSSWIRPGTKADLRWTQDPVRHGQYAVTVKGAEGAACFIATVPIQTGQVYLCSIYARGTVKDPETVQLKVQWQDKDKQWFGDAPAVTVALPAARLDDWTPLQVMFTAPPGAAYAAVAALGSDMQPTDTVSFDDCSVKQVPMQ